MATTDVTPYRKTHVRFDIAHVGVLQDAFSGFWAGTEIARGGLTPENSVNVSRLATGGIILQPLQERPDYLHERSDNQNAVVPISDMTVAPGVIARNTWRAPTDLTGVTVSPNVAATGDSYLLFAPASGGSFVSSLDTDIASFGQAGAGVEANIPVARRVVAKNTYPGDQSYQFDFVTPGRALHPADILGHFYFGHPLVTDQQSPYYGNGAYSLIFWGDGRVNLLEQQGFSQASNSPNWKGRDEWQYAEPGRVGNLAVSIRIHIYYTPDGTGRIEFLSGVSNVAHPASSFLQAPLYSYAASTTRHVYTVRRRLNVAAPPNSPPLNPQFQPPTKVSGAGHFRVDQREDLRTKFRVSLLKYQTAGQFQDLPFCIPGYGVRSAPLTILWDIVAPTGTTITGKLYDASNDTELSLVSSTATSKTYQANPNQPNYYARFFLTGDGATTPILWRYRVYQDSIQGNIAPGEFDTASPSNNAILRGVNISGPESDPSHETASLQIEDLGAEMNFLAGRSRIRTRIETEYDPLDSTKRSVLMDAFAQRSVAKRRGTDGRLFPSPLWRHFDVTFNGMWQKLHEHLCPKRLNLLSDPFALAQTGIEAPYKVTDIVRALIGYAGFANSSIDIPDSPVRFSPSGRESAEELLIDPLANIGETVVKLLKDYLGWFLIWNGNAAYGDTQGMWQARPGKRSPYTNLAYFQTGGNSGKYVSRPESYGTPNWAIKQDGTLPTGFIRKRTLERWVKPPEANAVCVTGTGDILPGRDGAYQLANWAYNHKSYNCFVDSDGNTVETAFPTNEDGSVNPDYIGQKIPLYIIDHTLDYQPIVDILCRRYFDVTCHAIQMWNFEAPLLLVTDPDDAYQVNPRPLRYYDPILCNDRGTLFQLLIRNVNPIYEKDHIQMARYECEAPRI